MRVNHIRTVFIAACIGVIAAGCQAPQRYYWGHYEDAVYVATVDPGSLTPNKQIDILRADAREAATKNQQLPPGFHANLGYLYYQVGDMENAKLEFESEKHQFPESTVLMDRMLGHLVRK
jgi:hypothetical protein